MTADEPLTMLAAGEAFYAGALARITRLMIVLAVVASGAGWWKYGWRVALGFVCGCAVAYLNFHWLKKVVAALADRATEATDGEAGPPPSSAGMGSMFMNARMMEKMAVRVQKRSQSHTPGKVLPMLITLPTESLAAILPANIWRRPAMYLPNVAKHLPVPTDIDCAKV